MTSDGGDSEREWYVDLARPIIKFVVAVAVLVTLWWLVENVQAAQQVQIPLPGSAESISMAGVLQSVLTLILMIAIVAFASNFGRILREGLDIDVLESLSKLAGLAIAVVFAYFMFDWVTQTFPGYSAQYDIAFLIAGIAIVGWLGLVLYSNVDEVVESIG